MNILKFKIGKSSFLSIFLLLPLKATAVDFKCPMPNEINKSQASNTFLDLSAQVGSANFFGSLRANDFSPIAPQDLEILNFEEMTYYQKPGTQARMTCKYKMKLKGINVDEPMNIIGDPQAPYKCQIVYKGQEFAKTPKTEKNEVIKISCTDSNPSNCSLQCP